MNDAVCQDILDQATDARSSAILRPACSTQAMMHHAFRVPGLIKVKRHDKDWHAVHNCFLQSAHSAVSDKQAGAPENAYLGDNRGNDRIAHLYEPTHPAVLRTIKSVVGDAHRKHIPVAVCGEMAGDPIFAPLLLGLGVDELSVEPAALDGVRAALASMTLPELQTLASRALAAPDAETVRGYVREMARTE